MVRKHVLWLGVVGLVGCSLDWASLDPRDEDPTDASSSGTTGATSGGGGATASSSGSVGGASTGVSTGGAGGAGGAPDCLIPLSDPFTAFDPLLWDVETDSGTCVAEFGPSGLTLGCASDDNARSAELHSDVAYDFESCGVVVEVESFVTGMTSAFGLELTGVSQRYAFEVEGGSLKSIQVINNNTKSASTSFNPALHRWWRIRGVDGCVAWDTSSNGSVWDEFRRRCDASLGELEVTLYLRADKDAPNSTVGFAGLNQP